MHNVITDLSKKGIYQQRHLEDIFILSDVTNSVKYQYCKIYKYLMDNPNEEKNIEMALYNIISKSEFTNELAIFIYLYSGNFTYFQAIRFTDSITIDIIDTYTPLCKWTQNTLKTIFLIFTKVVNDIKINFNNIDDISHYIDFDESSDNELFIKAKKYIDKKILEVINKIFSIENILIKADIENKKKRQAEIQSEIRKVEEFYKLKETTTYKYLDSVYENCNCQTCNAIRYNGFSKDILTVN